MNFLKDPAFNAQFKRTLGYCVAGGAELSVDTLTKALEQLKVEHIPLKIPFEEGFLPGYLYLSDKPNSKLLIDTGGGDSTLEELYFSSAAPALKR